MSAERRGAFDRLFSWFEGRIEPFPPEAPERPPDRLLPFLWHFARPAWPWLLLMSLLTALVSVLEVALFGFLGNLVDWLGGRDPVEVLQGERTMLIVMGLTVVVVLPLVGFLQSAVLHQGVLGNYVMTIRWKAPMSSAVHVLRRRTCSMACGGTGLAGCWNWHHGAKAC